MALSPDNYIYIGTIEGIYRIKLSDLISDVDDNSIVTEIEMTISPNPTSENISISISGDNQNQCISIFNSLGIEVKRIDANELLGKSSIEVSTSGFPMGMYYCILNNGQEKITKSFVVIR